MTGTLDIITLVLVLALGHAIAALLLFFGTRQRAQLYDTVFMVSMALQAAAWLLIAFRGTLPDLLTFSFANTLIFIGFCLEGIALLSLVRPVDRRYQKIMAAILIATLIIWWVPYGGPDMKMGLTGFFVAFFFFFPAYTLVFSAQRSSPLLTFIGSTVFIYIGATLARAVFILMAGSYNLAVPTFFQVLFLLVQIVMLVLVCAGYILIRREFAAADLEEDISRRRKIEEEFLAQSGLLEDRVRELRCLYMVSRLIETTGMPETFLPALAKILPQGMRHPVTTSVRILWNGKDYRSDSFRDGLRFIRARLQVNGTTVGSIEIIQNDAMTHKDDPAFSPEETELLAAVAERVSRMLERISAEAARHESEEKYRRLFEQVTDAIIIADTTTRQLVDCNRRAEELLGYSRAEILRMTADRLHPPEIQAQTMERFRAFLEGSTTSIETEVITRFGKRVAVSINATPIEFDGSTHLIGIFRDITWQKEVEKAIREKTEEIDQFFSTSIDLFCIADMEGHFRRLNPEWETTLGWPVAELEGKKFLDFVHPDDIQATLDAIQDLDRQKDVTGFVNRYRHRDGTYRWIEWRSAPKGTRIFAAARDITRHHLDEHYSAALSQLKQDLLVAAPLSDKLRKITDTCVSVFGADFARIWISRPGDLCDQGCIPAGVSEGINACRDHAQCLHLMVSSGRYTHTDGGHRRVPLGAYKIGRIATGEETFFITNDVVHDPRVHDHAWAASLGLAAFAGFRLLSAEGKPVGVLAFFSRQPIPPEVVRYLEDLATTTSQVTQTAEAEEALRESQEKFSKTFQAIPDLVLLSLVSDTRIIEVNKMVLPVSGYLPEELTGQTINDLKLWVDAAAREKYKDIIRRDGKVLNFETEFRKKNGEIITCLISGTLIMLDIGPCFISVIRDITERKRITEALRASEQDLRTILQTTRDGFWIIELPQGRFSEVNETFCRMSGYSREELLALHIPDIDAGMSPAEQEAQIQNVMVKGSDTFEAIHRRKDGSTYHVELSVTFLPKTGGGRLICFCRDISGRKRMEEALRESEEKYRTVVERANEAILIAQDGVFVFGNASLSRLLGMPLPDLMGKPFTAFIVPEDREMVLSRHRERLGGADLPASYDFRILTADGVEKWVSLSTARIAWKGRPATINLLNDIHERKRADEAMQAAVKLNQMIDTMSVNECMIYTLDEAERLTASRIGFFHFLNNDEKTIQLIAWSTETKKRCFIPKEPERHYPVDKAGVWVDCIRERRPVIHNDYASLPHKKGLPEGHVPLHRELVVPIFDGEKTVAIIGVGNKAEDYDEWDISILSLLAKNAWTLIRRKQIEGALRESGEKFQAIFNSTFQFTGLMTPDGILLEANDAAVSFTGVPREEILNRPFWETPWWRGDEESVQRLKEAIQKAAAGEFVRYEVVMQGAGGVAMPADFSLKPVRDKQGRVHLLIPEARDITDQKMAEEALRDEMQFSDAIIDSIPGIFYLLDERGYFIRTNSNLLRVTGLSIEEFPRTNALDTIAEEDRQLVAEKIDEVFSHGSTTVTCRILTRDGQKIPYLLSGFLLEVGGKMFLVGTGIDISEQVRAEEELRESEEKYRAIFAAESDVFIIIDQETWQIIDCNDAVLRMYGFTREELIGQSIAVISDEPEATRETIRTSPRTVPQRLHRKKNGLVFPVEIQTDLITLKGRPVVVGAVRDITARKAAEEALRRSEEKYRAIIENIPDMVYQADMNGVFTMVNPSGARLVGLQSPEQLIGTPVADHYLHPENRNMFLAELKKTGSVENFPVTLRKVDGSILYVLVSSHLRYDSEGKMLGVEGIIHDVTELRMAEEALRESEEKFRAIIENMQDMVYRVGIDGKFQMVSPSGVRLLGFETEEQMVGLPVTAVYADPDNRRVFLEELKKTGSVYGYPLELRARDGTLLHVVASSHYFHDAAGQIAGVEGVLHNVTELRKAEDALRTANRKLNLLSGITRHDIRNQILALKGYLQLSEGVIDNREKLARFISQELKVADTIDRQIGFTKDYEDLGVKSMVWQDTGALIRDAATSLPLGTISLDNQCEGIEIYADPLLGKVFYNLIDNSLHYGGPGMTTIRIFPRQDGATLQIVYEDDGDGISAADKKKLFSKGFGKHTGLGLFLSREILSITGITIVEEGEPGTGVRFVITIPAGMFRTGGM